MPPATSPAINGSIQSGRNRKGSSPRVQMPVEKYFRTNRCRFSRHFGSMVSNMAPRSMSIGNVAAIANATTNPIAHKDANPWMAINRPLMPRSGLLFLRFRL